MAIPLTVNGVTFQFPQQFDKNWGPSVTNWAQAVTNGLLQRSGGSFPLTAEVDFGSSFGIKVLSIKSEETNIAQTGFLRLANASTGLVWRNSTNTTDLPLTVNASNQLTFNGINVGATTSLTNTHILVGDVSNQPADVAMSGDATITNAGVVTIANNAITNVKVDPSAGIALSKLASTSPYFWYAADSGGVLTPLGVTASRAVVSDVNGLPSASSTTATEIGYVSGVTSAIQTQVNAKVNKSGDTMSGPLAMGNNKITGLAQGTNSNDAIAFPVTGAEILNSTITETKLANQAVTAAKIANNTITATQIANNTITASQIANATITATQIANGTITASQIANATITTSQIGSTTILLVNLAPEVTNQMGPYETQPAVTFSSSNGTIFSYTGGGFLQNFKCVTSTGAFITIKLDGNTVFTGGPTAGQYLLPDLTMAATNSAVNFQFRTSIVISADSTGASYRLIYAK